MDAIWFLVESAQNVLLAALALVCAALAIGYLIDAFAQAEARRKRGGGR